jgi:hypothetical protein
MSPVVETGGIASVGVLQEQDVVEDSTVRGVVQVAGEGSPGRMAARVMERLARRLTDEVANGTVHLEHLEVV